jgi:hypothetical protein
MAPQRLSALTHVAARRTWRCLILACFLTRVARSVAPQRAFGADALRLHVARSERRGLRCGGVAAAQRRCGARGARPTAQPRDGPARRPNLRRPRAVLRRITPLPHAAVIPPRQLAPFPPRPLLHAPALPLFAPPVSLITLIVPLFTLLLPLITIIVPLSTIMVPLFTFIATGVRMGRRPHSAGAVPRSARRAQRDTPARLSRADRHGAQRAAHAGLCERVDRRRCGVHAARGCVLQRRSLHGAGCMLHLGLLRRFAVASCAAHRAARCTAAHY